MSGDERSSVVHGKYDAEAWAERGVTGHDVRLGIRFLTEGPIVSRRVRGTSMTWFEVDPGSVDDTTEAEWSRLACTSLVENPWFTPQWQAAAARHLGEPGSLRWIGARASGRMIAGVAVRPVRQRWGPLRATVAANRLPGSGYAVGLGSPLLSRRDPDVAARALVRALVEWSRAGGPGLVRLEWVDFDEGGTGHRLLDACRALKVPATVRAAWQRPVVRRDPSGRLSLEPAMGRETRRQIGKRRRRMEARLGAELVLTDRQDDEAVEDFLRLEASGWKGDQGSAYSSTPALAAWFRDACSAGRRDGTLHLFCLQLAERVVAIQCCLVAGREAFFFRVGHDVELDGFGPGVLVQVLAVERVSTMGVDVVDSCADEGNEFLAGLYPDRRRIAHLLLGTGRASDRVIITALDYVGRFARR